VDRFNSVVEKVCAAHPKRTKKLRVSPFGKTLNITPNDSAHERGHRFRRH
jgi:hypothetical protein